MFRPWSRGRRTGTARRWRLWWGPSHFGTRGLEGHGSTPVRVRNPTGVRGWSRGGDTTRGLHSPPPVRTPGRTEDTPTSDPSSVTTEGFTKGRLPDTVLGFVCGGLAGPVPSPVEVPGLPLPPRADGERLGDPEPVSHTRWVWSWAPVGVGGPGGHGRPQVLGYRQGTVGGRGGQGRPGGCNPVPASGGGHGRRLRGPRVLSPHGEDTTEVRYPIPFRP